MRISAKAKADARMAAIIEEGKDGAFNPAVAAEYSSISDNVTIAFKNGVRLEIPRLVIPAAAKRSRGDRALFNIVVEPHGTMIEWPEFDDGYFLGNLIEKDFGLGIWLVAGEVLYRPAREESTDKGPVSKKRVRKSKPDAIGG